MSNFICSPIYLHTVDSGDVIVEVNGRPVRGVRDVLDSLGLEVGREMTLKAMRRDSSSAGGGSEYVTVRLRSAPET